MAKLDGKNLYLVISEACGMGRGALEMARQAIDGGVDIIQMREKGRTRQELKDLGLGLRDLCRERGVLFIVNDDPLLAAEVGADGVHLGQEDLLRYPLPQAREILGRDKIIGLSTSSPGEAQRADGEDVDYIAYGPVFPTKVKNYSIGTAGIPEVLAHVSKPVVMIGGIDLFHLGILLKMGVQNIALIRGILEAPDIAAAAREFKSRLEHS
jgi:thiamine-phosphate pyrophosphorylase